MKRREFFRNAGLGGLGIGLCGAASIPFLNLKGKENPRNTSAYSGVYLGLEQITPQPNGSLKWTLLYPNGGVQWTLLYPYSQEFGHCEWDDIDDLMQKKQVNLCVLDKYPESYLAEKFACRHPGHVVLIGPKHYRDLPDYGSHIGFSFVLAMAALDIAAGKLKTGYTV